MPNHATRLAAFLMGFLAIPTAGRAAEKVRISVSREIRVRELFF